ncbi:MAG: apolipoprotein N-acyltransferase [Salinispira sp.]
MSNTNRSPKNSSPISPKTPGKTSPQSPAPPKNTPKKYGGTIHALFPELGGIALSVVLFYLSFPNNFSHNGFGALGFVALFPLARVINRAPLWRLLIYAPLTGFTTYALFNIWLINFHPLAIIVVPVIYAVYYLILIPLMKLPTYAFGRHAWLIQVIIWVAYEYVRTLGFLGYPYGIIAYTQYLNIPLLNFASLGGISAVSALIVMPQFFLAQILDGRKSGLRFRNIRNIWNIRKELAQRFREKICHFKAEIIGMGVLFSFALLYGVFSQVNYSDAPRVKMTLVQQNVDPWIGGLRAYKNSMDASIRQTRRALEETPDTELIVWSETSFIPAIDFHSTYRNEVEKYELVDELLEYIDSTNIPVLLGNGDGQLVMNEEGEYVREDYNAVYLYKNRSERQIYRKLHLVPFSEYFPYKKQLPWLHKVLVDSNTSFWEKGDEWTVFELENLKNVERLRFSTPICFEDSFAYLNRGFVQRGADLIINVTNDSWSKSIPAAVQHAAMAVFRSVENRRTVVRSTNGGLTVVIDPNGRIIQRNEPFTESFITVDVPIYTQSTGMYTRTGDIPAQIFLTLAVVLSALSVGIVCKAKARGAE